MRRIQTLLDAVYIWNKNRLSVMYTPENEEYYIHRNFQGVTVLLVRYLQQQTVLRQGRYLTMSLYTDII